MSDEANEMYVENQKKLMEDMPDIDPSTFPEHMKLPDMDTILKMLENMDGVSEEDKEKLRSDLLNQGLGGLGSKSRPRFPERNAYDYYVFITMIALIVIVFVFFGYKLYKSLVEKQRKQEEKAKAKQLKKKK